MMPRDRFALVAVTGPIVSSRTTSSGQAGMRTARFGRSRDAAIGSLNRRTTVKGAGQSSR